MNETNGWKWATLILVTIFLLLLSCLCGALGGGLLGLGIGSALAWTPSYPLEELPFAPLPEPDWPGPQQLSRPWLGVTFEMVDEGALLVEIVPDSPADEAGLRAGDIITEVNGETVDAIRPLSAHILKYHPRDHVTLTFLRDGEEQEVEAELGRLPVALPWGEPDFPFEIPPSNGG
ncbi:MAG: PDZ domain-containing protein [Chloroflexota bacterium]|nr:PDZ domain-containing protein [Chloroflexota bacterium]